MSMFTSFNISASGMTAQQLRVGHYISEYSKFKYNKNFRWHSLCEEKQLFFTEKTLTGATAIKGANSNGSSFASALRNASGGRLGDGVKVTSVL